MEFEQLSSWHTRKQVVNIFYCFTVHFDSLNITYQLMHFYI